MSISHLPRQFPLSLNFFAWVLPLFAVITPLAAETRTAASAQFGDVKAAVAAAGRGDTIRVPAGTASWGANRLVLNKGIKLIGAGRDNTLITSSGSDLSTTCIWIEPDVTASNNGEEFRIEGFTFEGGAYQIFAQNIDPNIKLAIGWNRFKNGGNTSVGTRGQARGVIYQNEFDKCHRILGAGGLDTIREYRDYPFAFGTRDELYFESNYIHFSSTTPGNATGWSEIGQGGRAVLRYNTYDYTNAAESETLDIHGFQGFNGPIRGSGSYGQTGSMGTEMYGNTITGTLSFRSIMHRGGEGLFFNNIISGSVSPGLQISQYGNPAIDNGGGGCQADVEAACGTNSDCGGVTFASTGRKSQVNNTYGWNNLVNGTLAAFTNNAALPDHCGIADGTDFWNYNASFGNGENGIGRGTSAPTTTGNPDGAAYWVSSTATPTADPAIVQDGHLWKRVGGVWVDYYHPYTYPHPLTGPQPTSSPAPAPPTALRVVPHA